ncbi:hypothetical protein L195_g062718, partial [Trifolium pratense]
ASVVADVVGERPFSWSASSVSALLAFPREEESFDEFPRFPLGLLAFCE